MAGKAITERLEGGTAVQSPCSDDGEDVGVSAGAPLGTEAAGDFPEDVDGMELFLEIYEPNGPGPVLRFDDGFERGCGGPMASARIEIDEIKFCHKCFMET